MKILKDAKNKIDFINSFVITGPVMAFIEVSPTNKYTVRSIDKTVHEKERIDSACTHHSYNSDVGRILEPCNSRCIGCGIAAPMA